jgi:hypothetical protein
VDAEVGGQGEIRQFLFGDRSDDRSLRGGFSGFRLLGLAGGLQETRRNPELLQRLGGFRLFRLAGLPGGTGLNHLGRGWPEGLGLKRRGFKRRRLHRQFRRRFRRRLRRRLRPPGRFFLRQPGKDLVQVFGAFGFLLAEQVAEVEIPGTGLRAGLFDGLFDCLFAGTGLGTGLGSERSGLGAFEQVAQVRRPGLRRRQVLDGLPALGQDLGLGAEGVEDAFETFDLLETGHRSSIFDSRKAAGAG